MRQRTVVFEPEARTDLAELNDWLAERAGSETAERFIDGFEAYLDDLAFFPERGTLHDDIRPGLRVIGYKKRATIAFRVTDSAVMILRVLYAGQDWTAAFADDDQR